MTKGFARLVVVKYPEGHAPLRLIMAYTGW